MGTSVAVATLMAAGLVHNFLPSLCSEERTHFECMFEDKGILNEDLFWVNSLSLQDDNSLSLHDEIYFSFRL
jgi:hypothetical protein